MIELEGIHTYTQDTLNMIHTFTITQRNGNTHTVYVDPQDRGLVESYTWSMDSPVYVYTTIHTPQGRTRVSLHRLLMNSGELVVDHVNRNTLDNRRSNLRVCTQGHNTRNTKLRQSNTTGYRGVVISRSSYKVQIKLNGDNKYYGTYTTRYAAAIVANIVRRELHGEFSVGDNVGNLHQLYYPELHH